MNEDLRIAPHVVESVVNHVSGAAGHRAAGVYNRALYLERALQRWSRYMLQQVAKARDPVGAGGEDASSDPP